jgi:hypothetical protein
MQPTSPATTDPFRRQGWSQGIPSDTCRPQRIAEPAMLALFRLFC